MSWFSPWFSHSFSKGFFLCLLLIGCFVFITTCIKKNTSESGKVVSYPCNLSTKNGKFIDKNDGDFIVVGWFPIIAIVKKICCISSFDPTLKPIDLCLATQALCWQASACFSRSQFCVFGFRVFVESLAMNPSRSSRSLCTETNGVTCYVQIFFRPRLSSIRQSFPVPDCHELHVDGTRSRWSSSSPLPMNISHSERRNFHESHGFLVFCQCLDIQPIQPSGILASWWWFPISKWWFSRPWNWCWSQAQDQLCRFMILHLTTDIW